MELAGQYRKQLMEPAEQAQLIAESLVSRWPADNRRYCGQGAGLDWQAKKALIGRSSPRNQTDDDYVDELFMSIRPGPFGKAEPVAG